MFSPDFFYHVSLKEQFLRGNSIAKKSASFWRHKFANILGFPVKSAPSNVGAENLPNFSL